MRPTINDIAREAGVSLATVDRVLNERPGVREATISRVNSAVEKLGYVRDVSAANLARQRHYQLAFVLPDGYGQFQRALQDRVREAAAAALADRTDVQLISVPSQDPHALVQALNRLDCEQTDGVAIVAPETPHVRDAITRLKAGGVAVVAMVSDLPNTGRDHFVGIDNLAAGRTAGVLMGRFLADRATRVLVVASSMQLRDSIERRLGFDQVAAEQFPALDILPTVEGHDDPDTLVRALSSALDRFGDIGGIYSLGAGNGVIAKLLSQRAGNTKPVAIAHELTPHTHAALESGTFDVVITQNTGHIIRSALRVLRAKSDRLPINLAQESIRIDVVLKENLPWQGHTQL